MKKGIIDKSYPKNTKRTNANKKEIGGIQMSFEMPAKQKKWRTLVKIWGMTDAPIWVSSSWGFKKMRFFKLTGRRDLNIENLGQNLGYNRWSENFMHKWEIFEKI